MSRGDEVLVPGPDQDVLLCCSGCSKLTLICPISLASYKWLKFRHIDWYEKAWGGQVVQQMRAKDRTFETVRNLYSFCHIWWHVYGTFCIWGVPCPAVVCCCDDWEIDFNVCMFFCLTFCQSEISWLRHTRASIARVSVGEPQCVGVPPRHTELTWQNMPKNETIKDRIEIIPEVKLIVFFTEYIYISTLHCAVCKEIQRETDFGYTSLELIAMPAKPKYVGTSRFSPLAGEPNATSVRDFVMPSHRVLRVSICPWQWKILLRWMIRGYPHL